MGRKRAPGNARLGQHIQRRSDGKLELRYPIPEDVRLAFADAKGQPRRQVIRQLQTTDIALANERADRHRVEIREQIDRARTRPRGNDLTDHLRRVFNLVKEDLASDQAHDERKRRESVSYGLPYEGKSTDAVVTTRQLYSRALRSANVEEKIAAAGWAADLYFQTSDKQVDRSTDEYKKILEQCCDVLIEANLAYIDAYSGRPEPIPEHPALAPRPLTSEDGNIAKTERGRMTLSEYLDECYIKEVTERSGARTASVQRDAVDRFNIIIGKKPIYLISTADCWKFADSLRQLPNPRLLNKGERKLSPSDQIARLQDGRITVPPLRPTTVNKHLTGIRTILSHAQERGDILKNPATGVRVKEVVEDEKKSRAFTTAELQRIFSQPLFTGCREGQSPLGLYKPGSVRIRDDRFWIPLLLLFTGARSSEVVGLAVEDVVIDHKTPHIIIRKNSIRRIKNVHSRRMVPIHDELLKLGFIEFAKSQKTRPSGQFFLMAEKPFYKDGKTGRLTEQSISNSLIMRDFNNYVLDHADAKSEEGSIRCFRNTFEDAQRLVIDSDELRSRITGRQIKSSVIHYTDNIPKDEIVRDKFLERLNAAINLVQFPSINLAALATAKS